MQGQEARGLVVEDGVVIPERELECRTSRSAGPGGQNVNKVATRVELRFDLVTSTAFDAATKERLRLRLGRRLQADGVVRIVAQRQRSRARNEAEARERLAELLRRALVVPKRRRPTRPSQASRQRRLEGKRRQAARKRLRRDLEA